MPDFVFAAQSARDENQIGSATARLVNCYAEEGERGIAIKSAPGLADVVQLGTGQVHQLLSTNAGVYASVGGRLVLWDGTTVTDLGGVPDAFATMAHNASQVALVSNNQYSLWDGTTLSQPSGGAFLNYGSVAYAASRFLLSQADGEAFQYTAINDGKTLSALDFASAEYKPDRLRKVINVGGLIWFLGVTTCEPWQTSGNADLPFSRLNASLIEKGVLSAEAAAVLSNSLMWVSTEGRAYRQSGMQPVDVTPQQVASTLKERDTVRVLPWQWQNHDFLTLRFADRPAWVFDAQAGLWWERATGAGLDAWEATATVHHNGKWYAGTNDGYLCEFTGYQDRGQALRREATSGNLAEMNEFSVALVDAILGGAGTVMWQISKNGGFSFSNERQRSFGAAHGDRMRITGGIGSATQVCLRLACADNTDFSIFKTSLEFG